MKRLTFTQDSFKSAMTEALEHANGYNVTDYDYDYWVGFRSFLDLIWYNLEHKRKRNGKGLPTKPDHFAYIEITDELPQWRKRLIHKLLGDEVDKLYLTTRSNP